MSPASAKPVPRRAMVLAAGKGLRLRPLTERVPKPLVEIGGRTLLGHALDLLVAAGVGEMVVNAHYLADAIEAFVAAYDKAHPALRLHLSREDTLLETGGGVRRALGKLGDEPFYVLNSDVILRDGAEVKLQTRPLDPRDLLRGDYVVLGYDISQVAAGALKNQPASSRNPTVFVKLAPNRDGLYEAVSVHTEPVAVASPEVLIRGRRRPLVGTVSMDNVTVDLGAETDVEPGDEAVLIGVQGDERILAEEVAARLGTINYEIACGVSARVPREPA